MLLYESIKNSCIRGMMNVVYLEDYYKHILICMYSYIHTGKIFSSIFFFLMDYTDSGWNEVNILHSSLYGAVFWIYDQIRVDITLVLCSIKHSWCQSFLFFPPCTLRELRMDTAETVDLNQSKWCSAFYNVGFSIKNWKYS